MRERSSNKGTKTIRNAQEISCKKNLFLYIAITAVLVCIFLAFGSLKEGYHIDEIATFGLSNHLNSLNDSIYPTVEDGIIYSGQEYWDEYATVKDGGRFDYANVLKNQSDDVHPPMYYIFIHTLSSMFPDLSMMWVGLLVNILFDIIIYWQLVWIIRKLRIGKVVSIVLSAFYVLGIGFIGYAVVFFRMYALLAVWMNFMAMVFFANKPEENVDLKYCLSLAGALLGGLLTQYYFMIFAFFACLVYACFVIAAKNWKKLIFSVAAAGATGGVWLLLWPVALEHIFSDYRGTEAIENMLTGGIRENLWSYMEKINSGIFGGLFAVILAVLICLFIVCSDRISSQNNREEVRVKAYQYALLIIPACLYIAVIAKIAPYNTLRYVISLSAFLYIAVFGGMINLAEHISKRGTLAILALAGVVLFCGYRNEIDNIYAEEDENIETLLSYEDTLCLYFYDNEGFFKVKASMQEISVMDTVVFMDDDDWEEIIIEQTGYSNIIVFITDSIDADQDTVLTSIMATNDYSHSEQLFTSGYTTCYVLN